MFATFAYSVYYMTKDAAETKSADVKKARLTELKKGDGVCGEPLHTVFFT